MTTAAELMTKRLREAVAARTLRFSTRSATPGRVASDSPFAPRENRDAARVLQGVERIPLLSVDV